MVDGLQGLDIVHCLELGALSPPPAFGTPMGEKQGFEATPPFGWAVYMILERDSSVVAVGLFLCLSQNIVGSEGHWPNIAGRLWYYQCGTVPFATTHPWCYSMHPFPFF